MKLMPMKIAAFTLPRPLGLRLGGGLLAAGGLLLAPLLFGLRSLPAAEKRAAVTGAPVNLLDARLSHWYKWLGVPHTSVTGLPAGTPTGDGLHGIPLGRHDPKSVFTVLQLDGEPVLRVSGEILGGLTTKQQYANYHLRLRYKWGRRKWLPRPLARPRDTGVLFHLTGSNEDAYWSVFMMGLECQVSEKTTGDLLFMPNKDSTLLPVVTGRVAAGRRWAAAAPLQRIGASKEDPKFHRSANHESDATSWTTVDVYTVGSAGACLVNGHVVMAFQDAGIPQPGGAFRPLNRGKIQLQSEGAEVYYKDISIQPIAALPARVRQAAGLD